MSKRFARSVESKMNDKTSIYRCIFFSLSLSIFMSQAIAIIPHPPNRIARWHNDKSITKHLYPSTMSIYFLIKWKLFVASVWCVHKCTVAEICFISFLLFDGVFLFAHSLATRKSMEMVYVCVAHWRKFPCLRHGIFIIWHKKTE